jgi:hypothetical protein
MDIIRTCCLVCGNVPEHNDTGNTKVTALDQDGEVLGHLVLTPHCDGYMVTDELNYRAWFQKCVCSLACGRTLIERFTRKVVTFATV